MTKPSTLADALVAIQADAPKIPLDSTNPHYKSKFASLAGVMERVLPVTAKHGLAVTQLPTVMDGEPALTTRLIHSSGEVVESTMLLLPAKRDPQGQGSALTYARRYMVLSMLGLVGDEDDDGNTGSRAAVNGKAKLPSERVEQIIAIFHERKLKAQEIGLVLGAAGIDGLRANSAKAIRERIESLTEDQAEALQTVLNG